MKSLQEYIEIYRGIARGLNLKGDSVELLSQMLANATYISEVEHIAYSQEASLERATLMNSKIQHCMNEMYSVFRGSCPRVIIRFKSNSYFTWNVFDEIATSNNFSVYYLGYLNTNEDTFEVKENMLGTSAISDHPGFNYSPVVIPPTGDDIEYTIIALISPKLLRGSWSLQKENLYYVDFLESNLSNDIMVKVNGEYHDITRVFSDHIKDASIFDLTLPDFGLRLYAPDIFRSSLEMSITDTPANTEIYAEVFRYSELESYNLSELKQLKIKGTRLSSIPSSWSASYNYPPETAPGLIYIPEVSRDTLGTIHYKANRDRYMGSILRSNSDIGVILEEMYPDKVRKSGTSYRFESLKTTKKIIQENINNFSLTKTDKNFNGKNLVNTLPSGISLYGYSGSDYKLENGFSYNPASYPGSVYTERICLESTGKFEDTQDGTYKLTGVIGIPVSGQSGVLRVFHKNSYSLGTAASYDILPSSSVVLKRYTELDNKLSSEWVTKELGINIIRSSFGVTDILSVSKLSSEGLKLYYSWDSSLNQQSPVNGDSLELDGPMSEKIILILKDTKGNELDREIIPIVYLPGAPEESKNDYETVITKETTGTTEVITTTSSSSGKSTNTSSYSGELVLDISNNCLYLETTDKGEIVTPLPIKVSLSVFSGGSLITERVSYSVVSSFGVLCSIDSSGILTITDFDSDLCGYSIAVQASYMGVSLSGVITVKTALTTDAFKTRELMITDDPSGRSILGVFKSESSGSLSEFKYINEKNTDYLYLWAGSLPGIQVYSIDWIESKETYENILQEGEEFSPSLTVYYIPQLPSSILTDEEIKDYVSSKSSYYVTHDISVKRGNLVNVLINLRLELFQNSSVDSQVSSILENYSYSFGVDLENKRSEIISSISKIANVKCINSLEISYSHELGKSLVWEDIVPDLDKTYFVINYQISSTITS